jgi:predicted nuclease of predicted toxin-antitoxin system
VLRFVLDEHVDPAVVDAVHALEPTVDVVRVQDVGLRTQPDPTLIACAARNDRLIVTNDQALVGFVYARLATGTPFPGVVVYSNRSSIGQLAEDIVLVAVTHTPEQAENQVFYSPL